MRPLLLLCVAAALAGCGATAKEPASTKPSADTAAAATSARFDTATVPGLTVSPQEVYEQAKMVCALKHTREIAADFNLMTGDHGRIAARYARGYRDPIRAPAEVGCREGLEAYAQEHPGEQPLKPDRAELAQRFYLRVDDYAIKLQDAIAAAQRDDHGARSALARLRERIATATRTYRRQTRKRSAGARQLVEIADNALDAIDASDVRALVRARVASFDARKQLVGELGG